jgi:hypothetical protein
MLVLTDRGFDAAGFLEAVAATKAQFLARLTSTRRLPVMARLDDGTFLSRIGALTVRIIEAEVIRCYMRDRTDTSSRSASPPACCMASSPLSARRISRAELPRAPVRHREVRVTERN